MNCACKIECALDIFWFLRMLLLLWPYLLKLYLPFIDHPIRGGKLSPLICCQRGPLPHFGLVWSVLRLFWHLLLFRGIVTSLIHGGHDISLV